MDVGVSAGYGAVAPGMLAVGKTTWKSGNAIKALSSQATKTANRAEKINSPIATHKSNIKDVIATQAAFQGAKAISKNSNNETNTCGCQR